MCPQILPRLALLVLCASVYAADRVPTFAFADFKSNSALSLVGSASRAGSVLRLTTAKEQISGGAWFPEKQAIGNGFETTFQFQLTEQGGLGHGADGFAFVLQNSGPTALAGRGAAGGFALGDGWGNPKNPGIPRSIAVFFDTFRNAGEPSDNYIAVCTNGSIGEMRWPPPRLGFTRKLHVKLKDRRVHSARVLYKPPILSVFLDDPDKPVLNSTVDLSTVVDAEGRAYIGFTASTGAGYENHDILSWLFTAGPKTDVSSSMVTSSISFMNAACLPARNLCTPDRAVVEETAAGRFHIVLPANLEWGASIPNPSGRPVSVTNGRGTVCWGRNVQRAEDCGGPAALISRTKDGRTYFSLDNPRGKFDDNEGFIEFDAELQ